MEPHPVEPFDLLIRNGHLIDPAAGRNGIADIGICNGVIAAVACGLSTEGCPDTRDATGFYVSPGWIDLHGHWYEAGLYGINTELYRTQSRRDYRSGRGDRRVCQLP